MAEFLVYLGAGTDVAMSKQVFVKSRKQLVKVRRRIHLSLTIANKLLVAVFFQFPKLLLLYEDKDQQKALGRMETKDQYVR